MKKLYVVLVSFFLLAIFSGAQSPANPQSTSPQQQQQAGSSVRPTPAPVPKAPTTQEPAKPSPLEQEVKITPREAEELFHSIDEILAFDSRQTGLPIKRDVKRKLTSRDEFMKFVTMHENDEDVQRLKRSELVLKKFGLLPRDFDMEKLLDDLLREEVAGYYDPKTRTVNLLDWVPAAEQEPVMAHELTHALQDQSIGLQRWMKKGDKDLGESKKDPTPADIENDEMDNAREAVIEGQAQAMMFQYALAPTGRSIADSPALVDAMLEETLTETPSTKVFNGAPIFMKESLTFPYNYGMEFVVQLMHKVGREKAFAGVLRNPPHTTRQIMEPETYLSGEKIEPMRLPNFKQDFKNYQKVDIGAMGEFDVAVLVEQYAGKPLSRQLFPDWRGGYYFAVRPKADGAKADPAKPDSTKPDSGKTDAVKTGSASESLSPLGLLYVSRWSSAEKASEFAAIYAHALAKRYKKAREADAGKTLPGAPVSDQAVADKPAVQSLESKFEMLKGRHAWTTEEGTVVIEEEGDTVLVSESLDAATTEMVEKEVFGK